ncbi:MAG: hypothetical protein A2X94_00840 [Bdellovibrionales bacterium GWB1_55_8]|nr:MAG: hypothetical protein A2X94_00840 [Bdellovibrionales bacterium GWB1_55_8]
MAMRIRTVKPELYRHRDLYELEQETQLPIRFAWTGLFGVCDREGRFRWEPEVIKLDVLPFDNLNFGWVLDALAAKGFLIKYRPKYVEPGNTCTHVQARAEKCIGWIPTFLKHQRPNLREAKSNLPLLDDTCEVIPVEFPAISQRTCTHMHARGEVEMEGKGNGSGRELLPARSDKKAGKTIVTWEAYRGAYEKRYGVAPVRNKTINSQLAHFTDRIGEVEAPLVAEFYLSHNDAFYVKSMHSVGLMLRDAEKLRSEWATGRKMTASAARSAESLDHYQDQMRRISEGSL